MATTKNKKGTVTGDKVTTPPGQLSYPSVFEKNTSGETPSNKYDTSIYIPKSTDISAVLKVADEVAMEAFGKTSDKFKNPAIKDGDEKDDPNAKGHWVITARSDRKPPVVGPKKESITDPEMIYGGVSARISIHPYSYDTKGNKGVGWSLRAVQFIGHNERFGGAGADPDVEFDEVETGSDIDAPF